MTVITTTPAPSAVASALVDEYRATGSTSAMLALLWDALEDTPAESRGGFLAAVAIAAAVGQGEAIALAERLVASGPR